MKINMIRKLGAATAIALAAAFVTLAATEARAEKGAGAAALIGKPISSVSAIKALQPGDRVAMACPKCKTITISYVDEGKGAVKQVKSREQHQCPGCKTTITTKGVGKQAKDEIVHVCQKCGSDLAFCCSLKGGDTKGMEKK